MRIIISMEEVKINNKKKTGVLSLKGDDSPFYINCVTRRPQMVIPEEIPYITTSTWKYNIEWEPINIYFNVLSAEDYFEINEIFLEQIESMTGRQKYANRKVNFSLDIVDSDEIIYDKWTLSGCLIIKFDGRMMTVVPDRCTLHC